MSETEQEKSLLQHQLDMQEKRHEVQTEYLKSVSSNVKLEHVTSLKQELHRTFQDKVDIQMYAQEVEDKCQELEDKCSENEETIETLQKKNATLQDGIKDKDKQLKALTEKLMRKEVRKKKRKESAS